MTVVVEKRMFCKDRLLLICVLLASMTRRKGVFCGDQFQLQCQGSNLVWVGGVYRKHLFLGRAQLFCPGFSRIHRLRWCYGQKALRLLPVWDNPFTNDTCLRMSLSTVFSSVLLTTLYVLCVSSRPTHTTRATTAARRRRKTWRTSMPGCVGGMRVRACVCWRVREVACDGIRLLE